jgi:hypothetical protein
MRRPFQRLKVLMMFLFAVFLCPPLFAVTADEYYQAGLSLYTQQNYTQAVPYLKAAVQLNPGHWQAYQLMGYCYYQSQDNINALDSFDKSVAINPENLELKTFADNLRMRTGIMPSAPAAAPAAAAITRTPTPKEARAFEKNKWIQLRAGGIVAGLGDLKTSADTFPDVWNEGVTSEAKADGMGFLVGVEGGYALDRENSLGLSIDGGFFGGYTATATDGFDEYKESYVPTMVGVGFNYYHYFLMGTSRIQLGGGPGFYLTMLKVSETFNGENWANGNMSGLGFGGTLNLGWEMAVSEMISINVNLRGRYASTSNIKADAQSTTTGEDMGEIGFVMYPGGHAGIAPVSAIGADGIRWANVDYTGVDADLGLTIHY